MAKVTKGRPPFRDGQKVSTGSLTAADRVQVSASLRAAADALDTHALDFRRDVDSKLAIKRFVTGKLLRVDALEGSTLFHFKADTTFSIMPGDMEVLMKHHGLSQIRVNEPGQVTLYFNRDYSVSASSSKLQAPQVNNNGTSKKELMDQLLAVFHAGRELEKALSNAAPHGRDYQTLKPGAYQEARKQHEDRQQRLQSIMKEIEDIAMQVQDQGRD